MHNKSEKRQSSHSNRTVKRGGSVLAKLALPGILLVANQIHKRKTSTYKNTSRRFRKTRKHGRR